MVARDDEHLVRVADRGARRAERVARAERLLLHGDVHAVEGVDGVGRDNEDERVGAERLDRRDDPVDKPAAEQRMQVLGRRGLHPRAEARGHDDGGEVAQSWGARIRTWDRGTKTRCLTTWLRPTTRRVSPIASATRLVPGRRPERQAAPASTELR